MSENQFFRSLGPLGKALLNQRRRDDNKNKICSFEGGGVALGAERKSSKTLFFVGNVTTINFEMQILLSRNFVVVAQAPIENKERGVWIGSVWNSQALNLVCSETGRIRFRGARFETPSSVSFFGPHRASRRELSEFLSAYYLCAKSELTEFFAELTEFAAELSEVSLPKQYS